MKYLRKFDSVSDMETTIASSEIDIIGLAYNNDTPVMRIKSGGSPVPPTPPVTKATPFYIDVRGAVTLAATSGLQMSTDGENWTDTVAGDLPTGKTYFRVANDQETPLRPNLVEKGDSDYDIGGNINSLVKVSFENDTTCYNFYPNGFGFFSGKHNLKSAGNLVLPATTLTDYCYSHMFDGCWALTTAPELPAMTLANMCYNNMFYNCQSLTTAPELLATTLADMCYLNMFQNCTSLNYIKCLATDISASSCISNWVKNVSSTGTFVKNTSMSESTWGSGRNGIPSGWTVEDAQN